MRAIIAFVVMIVLSLGVAAYFVNVPVLWIGIAEALVLLGIGYRVSGLKRPQALAESAHDQATKG